MVCVLHMRMDREFRPVRLLATFILTGAKSLFKRDRAI